MNRTPSVFPLLAIGLLLFTLIYIATTSFPGGLIASAASGDSQEIANPSQNGGTGVISARDSNVEWNANQQPWTTSRMLAAQPYPLPKIDGVPSTVRDQSQPTGEPAFIPSTPPENSSQATQNEEDIASLSSDSIQGYNYPAPFTRYENFDDYSVFPYSTVGVLFFTQNSTDYRCSAAAIGNNALWTAGHCVHDGSGSESGWSDNVVFAPAYKNGNTPFGTWTFYDVLTSDEWYTSSDFRYDFGGVILELNASDQTVDEVVGSLGFAYNLSPKQHWFNFGYPSNSPFDGKTMQICAGSFARNDPFYSFPMPMAMGCDMTPGSSGGPWIVEFSGIPGTTNYINGNNSYRYTGLDKEIYSPYFGEAAKELLESLSSDTRLRTNIHIPLISSNH